MPKPTLTKVLCHDEECDEPVAIVLNGTTHPLAHSYCYNGQTYCSATHMHDAMAMDDPEYWKSCQCYSCTWSDY
jgi:hypothetical protein